MQLGQRLTEEILPNRPNFLRTSTVSIAGSVLLFLELRRPHLIGH